MKKSERAEQARRTLDRRYAEAHLRPIRSVPRGGWVRAVREGLGMSQEALAKRLRLAPPNVAKLEAAERNGTVSLRRLARAADEMNCHLVYAIVPNTSLEDTVQKAAHRQAEQTIRYVQTTMGLEDQSIPREQLAEQLDRETARVIDQNRVWSTR